MITGQIFFRKAIKTVDQSGRALYMVVGLVAIPEGAVKSEHQYTVVGPNPDDQVITLSIPLDGIDRTEEGRGVEAGHLLTMPIWRY